MASVTLEIDDALAVVTISRPPLNLFTWEMWDELSDVVDQVAAAPLRALLLKASGQHFSAGASGGQLLVRPVFIGGPNVCSQSSAADP
jgi:enoyl-CoA hydratase/carnithine racemase